MRHTTSKYKEPKSKFQTRKGGKEIIPPVNPLARVSFRHIASFGRATSPTRGEGLSFSFVSLLRYVCFVLFLCNSISVWAENDKSAGVGGQILLVGIGARQIGLGESFCGLADDVNSIYWNPAGMASLTNYNVSLTHNEMPMEQRQEVAIVTTQFFAGSLGASVNYTNYGTFETRDEKGELTNETLSVFDFVLLFSYGQNITDFLSIGANLKTLYQRLGSYQYNWVLTDFGFLFKSPVENLKIGFAVNNFGPSVKGFSPPTCLKWGVSYKYNFLKNYTVIASSDVNFPLNDKINAGIGMEFAYYEFPDFPASIRLGYVSGSDLGWVAGIRAGLGIGWKNIRLDYAFIPAGDFGFSHRITLTGKI